ncbi:MAG: biotin/lipoyl-binding protein [Candidatus Taylorbacteria bacterium]|nr:biotin/lipoyl-binding protein [Candidatus Taylorbacteria bacterium]
MKQNWFKKKNVYIPTIVVAIAVLIFIYRSNRQEPLTSAVAVKRESIAQEVTVAGTVKAKEAVTLAFEKSGRLRTVNVAVGDRVDEGDVLLALENGVESSSVEDAKAKLASKQAHYDDLKKGGQPEEINLRESELDKAKSDLAANYAAAPNIILDAFNKADNAVHRQADILFGNTLSNNPQLNFYSADQQAALDAQSGRYAMEGIFNNFKTLIQTPLLNETRPTPRTPSSKPKIIC